MEERLRLAIGLPLRSMTEHAPVSKGIEESAIAEKYYDPPLINIIKFACHSCPDQEIRVTDACEGCLAHPCKEVCPKGAISIVNGRFPGGSRQMYPVREMYRRVSLSCDHKNREALRGSLRRGCHRKRQAGKSQIDYDKCVSCGMCLLNCPFGAIADKGQIFQVIHAMKTGTPVYAAVAPAFIGQFGRDLTPERLREAMKRAGIRGYHGKLAVGADLCTIQEAQDFLEEVPGNIRLWPHPAARPGRRWHGKCFRIWRPVSPWL